MKRQLGLAAQAVPGCDAWDLVEIAAAAGFNRVGITVAPERWSNAATCRVRAALADTGLVLQDVEVIRLHDHVTDAMRRQLDIAIALGANSVITIALSTDVVANGAILADLAAHCAGTTTKPILEFGRFTGVTTLADATAIAQAAGVALLADPLHLVRAGISWTALASLPPAMLPYAQICDAGPPPVDFDRATLLAEARDARRNLGDGTLDLTGFVAALPPNTPLMNEVRSRAMAAAYPDPMAHAKMLGRTMRAWLSEVSMAA